MAKYLKAYISSMPASQQTKLLGKIYGNVTSGAIKTIDQYNTELTAKLAEINTSKPEPSLVLRVPEKYDQTNSYDHNAMVGDLLGDLEVLYDETLLLEQATSLQSVLFDKQLQNIETLLKATEAKLTRYEFLNKNNEGYVETSYDTFIDESKRLTRVQPDDSFLFRTVDAALALLSDEELKQYDAEVSGEALKLAPDNEQIAYIGNAEIFSAAPSGITPSGMHYAYSPTDLVAGNRWANMTLVTSVNNVGSEVARCSLDLYLHRVSQLNRIKIVPFTKYPYYLESIQYETATGGGLTALHPEGLNETLIDGGGHTFDFSAIPAKRLRLNIRQENFSKVRYVRANADNQKATLWDVTVTGEPVQLDATMGDATQWATSNFIQSALNTMPETTTQTFDAFEFFYGIESLEISFIAYQDKSIYVAKPYRVEDIAAIGLETGEVHPLSSDSNYVTDIEYYVVKKDYSFDMDGDLYRTQIGTPQPILPTGLRVINCEQLDLGNESYADTRFDIDSTYDVVVSQNEIQLTEDTHYTRTGNRITIINKQPGAIYTIAYRAAENATLVGYDKVEQTYDQFGNALPIVGYSDIYLIVLLRRNTHNDRLTPVLTDYTLRFKRYE